MGRPVEPKCRVCNQPKMRGKGDCIHCRRRRMKRYQRTDRARKLNAEAVQRYKVKKAAMLKMLFECGVNTPEALIDILTKHLTRDSIAS